MISSILQKPERLFPAMSERPKCSSALTFVWDAMELVGRAKFGGDWTGAEFDALNWPISPDAAREQQAEQAKREAARPKFRPAAKVGLQPPAVAAPVLGVASSALANLQEDYSSHVWAWRADRYRAKQQSDWEANQAYLSRLRVCADWLHERFRDGEIATYSRWVAIPDEPLTMPPSEWYCEQAFLGRFVPGRYDRFTPGQRAKHAVYIFANLAQLERAVATLPQAEAIATAADLSACAPYLRFVVAFAIKHASELSDWGKDSLWRQIRDEWNLANPGDDMPERTAKGAATIMTVHDPEAIAQGKLGAEAKKRAATSKSPQIRQS